MKSDEGCKRRLDVVSIATAEAGVSIRQPQGSSDQRLICECPMLPSPLTLNVFL